jgi:hypothetical protein
MKYFKPLDIREVAHWLVTRNFRNSQTRRLGRTRVKLVKYRNTKSLKSSGPSIKRGNLWKEINISMTHRVEWSKGEVVRIHEMRVGPRF